MGALRSSRAQDSHIRANPRLRLALPEVLTCGSACSASHFEYAGPFTEIVLLGCLAILFPAKKLEWDGPNLKVTNVPEAEQYIKPKFRTGYSS